MVRARYVIKYVVVKNNIVFSPCLAGRNLEARYVETKGRSICLI